MPSFKLGRTTEDIHRELAAILREVTAPRVKDCQLSVVRAEVTNDLSYCTVYVSTMEGLSRTKEAVQGLKSAAGFIRRELGRRLSLRHVPQLIFKATDSIEYGTHISKLLHDQEPEGEPLCHVVLWDFGAKENIEKCLLNYGCEVICVPSFATAEQILSYEPEGVMLSNGPGDPAENVEVIEELKKLCAAKIPIMGICLGHQLLALANGAKTEKMKYGHRGANQPAVELATGKVFITSQNHGYAVINDSLPAGAEVSFINANDGTCEGVNYHNIPAFSVQFHPEACGGPLDTMFLFEKFMTRMEEEKTCR